MEGGYPSSPHVLLCCSDPIKFPTEIPDLGEITGIEKWERSGLSKEIREWYRRVIHNPSDVHRGDG